MTYARIENGSVVQYPYDMPRLKADNPNVSFPLDSFSRADVREAFNIVEVTEVAKPDEAAHHVSEGVPLNVSGVWTQVWDETPRNAEELAQQAINKRLGEYGTPEDQLEFIAENGLEAWQTKVAEIKAKYPKA
jgi:hypothetical protein|tara:strand:+ start:223 stop:621 length:399 start_codon:yes stop_codon:yes gene_type:complete